MGLESLCGKKLLVLVGGINLVSLVVRAKELGIYTIVTDYYDTVQSPAKLVADEYWDISWNDIDALEQKCKEEKIDGITTGYSESPVECCIQLCERLGLPCYCTEEQLEITRDKKRFKQECRKNGVPVTREYSNTDEIASFPVIIKPVDRAGSIGVGIARTDAELKRKYQYAYDKSYTHDVIIEEYIADGTKFDATYVIIDGEPVLVADCDTINGSVNGTERVVQSAWLFPSRHHDTFIRTSDPLLKKMIRNMGIKDGYIFFSGFAIKKDNEVQFKFFESGFRLSGEHVHAYLSKCKAIEVLDLFIFHALTGTSKGITFHPLRNKDMKCVMINYYAKRGVVTNIFGINRIKEMADCNFFIHPARIGQKCDDQQAILTKLCMVHFCNKSANKLADDVRMSNKYYYVENEQQEDMVYDRVDDSLIANWW